MVQVVINRRAFIELLDIDDDGKLMSIMTQPTFSSVLRVGCLTSRLQVRGVVPLSRHLSAVTMTSS